MGKGPCWHVCAIKWHGIGSNALRQGLLIFMRTLYEKRSTMTMFKRIGIILLVAIGGASCLELGEQLSIPGVYGTVSSADARGWSPADAGERRGRRAEVGAALCSGR